MQAEVRPQIVVDAGDFPPFLQSPINCGAFAMVAGLVIVPVVSFLTPRPDQKIIDFAFSGYSRTVTVTQREALGESKENAYFLMRNA